MDIPQTPDTSPFETEPACLTVPPLKHIDSLTAAYWARHVDATVRNHLLYGVPLSVDASDPADHDVAKMIEARLNDRKKARAEKTERLNRLLALSEARPIAQTREIQPEEIGRVLNVVAGDWSKPIKGFAYKIGPESHAGPYSPDPNVMLHGNKLTGAPNPIPAGANWTAAASTALFGEPKHAPSRCDWDKAVMTSDVTGIRREECRVRHEMAADLAEPKPEPVKAQTRGLFTVAPMDHKFGGWGQAGTTLIEYLIFVAIVSIFVAVIYSSVSGYSSLSFGPTGLTEARCIDGMKYVVGAGGQARQVLNEQGGGVRCQ